MSTIEMMRRTHEVASSLPRMLCGYIMISYSEPPVTIISSVLNLLVIGQKAAWGAPSAMTQRAIIRSYIPYHIAKICPTRVLTSWAPFWTPNSATAHPPTNLGQQPVEKPFLFEAGGQCSTRRRCHSTASIWKKGPHRLSCWYSPRSLWLWFSCSLLAVVHRLLFPTYRSLEYFGLYFCDIQCIKNSNSPCWSCPHPCIYILGCLRWS